MCPKLPCARNRRRHGWQSVRAEIQTIRSTCKHDPAPTGSPAGPPHPCRAVHSHSHSCFRSPLAASTRTAASPSPLMRETMWTKVTGPDPTIMRPTTQHSVAESAERQMPVAAERCVGGVYRKPETCTQKPCQPAITRSRTPGRQAGADRGNSGMAWLQIRMFWRRNEFGKSRHRPRPRVSGPFRVTAAGRPPGSSRTCILKNHAGLPTLSPSTTDKIFRSTACKETLVTAVRDSH